MFQETSLLYKAYATRSLTWKCKYGGIYDAALVRSYRNDNRCSRLPRLPSSQSPGRRFFRK